MVFETTLVSFVLYLLLRFFLLFPSPSLIDRKIPWLKTVGLDHYDFPLDLKSCGEYCCVRLLRNLRKDHQLVCRIFVDRYVGFPFAGP